MEALFKCVSNYANDEDILDKLAQIFNQIAELYYPSIGDYLANISEFTFHLVSYLFNFRLENLMRD